VSEKSAKTPLMEQYLGIKKSHKDAILFFRMGDFYEMFYEDAKTGSEVLGITLTSRAHGKAADVPLAGFPHHALDGYLAKMIKAGYRVAICEQVEDPKLAKTIVKREVTEIVTPGTAVSDDLLVTKQNNYLVALYLHEKKFGLAQVDVSTGQFRVGEYPRHELKEQIAIINPAELLLSEEQADAVQRSFDNLQNMTITLRDEWTFHYDYAHDRLLEHFGTLSLKGFGIETMRFGISAAGAILSYLKENQREKLVHINRISRSSNKEFSAISNWFSR